MKHVAGCSLCLCSIINCLFTLLITSVASVDLNSGFGDDFGNLVNGLASLMGGADSTCEFKCKNGAKPKSRAGHEPKSNGCGAYGIKIDLLTEKWMTSCCDKHDFCYDTCNNKRQDCDDKFKKCVMKGCKKQKDKGLFTRQEYEGCINTSSLIEAALKLTGCQTYLESQENACICHSHRKHKEL